MTVDPIKSKKDIERIKAYFLYKCEYRNFLMFVMGINTFLRIGDLVRLRLKDVYDFKKRSIKEEISITPKKTKKKNKLIRISVNDKIIEGLKIYFETINESDFVPERFLFHNGRNGNHSICEKTGWKIVKDACEDLGIVGNYGSHTMRKTKARQFYDDAKNKSEALVELMLALKHSNLQVTLSYIAIEKEEIDKVYLYEL